MYFTTHELKSNKRYMIVAPISYICYRIINLTIFHNHPKVITTHESQIINTLKLCLIRRLSYSRLK